MERGLAQNIVLMPGMFFMFLWNKVLYVPMDEGSRNNINLGYHAYARFVPYIPIVKGSTYHFM